LLVKCLAVCRFYKIKNTFIHQSYKQAKTIQIIIIIIHYNKHLIFHLTYSRLVEYVSVNRTHHVLNMHSRLVAYMVCPVRLGIRTHSQCHALNHKLSHVPWKANRTEIQSTFTLNHVHSHYIATVSN